MSELVLHSDVLNAAVEGKVPNFDQALRIMEESKGDSSELFTAACTIRESKKGKNVSFSSKVFINMTNLCRDTCTYCTYKEEPGKSSPFMQPDLVRSTISLAKKYGCTEALLVAGERPEEKYGSAKKWLADNGFSSTPDYATYCSQIAIEEGLYPHTNVGSIEYDEIMALKDTNPSIGVMLENSSPRLLKDGMPHHLAPSKDPKTRIRTLRDAGRAQIPITTGILVGIGEREDESVQSLEVIRDLQSQYGNIQEIIIQNFVPKPQTLMAHCAPPEKTYFARIVALARVMMPDMNIQIPPNLSPDLYDGFLRAGVNDWGGISPLTPDFVNPEMPWPQIQDLVENTKRQGFSPKCRFATYPEFFNMIPTKLRTKILKEADSDGYVREEIWRR